MTCATQEIQEKLREFEEFVQGSSAPDPLQREADDPLLFALKALAAQYRLPGDLRSFIAIDTALDHSSRLQKIAHLNHWRIRRVHLASGFQQRHSESLLAFLGEEELPVLLHPRGGGTTYLDPRSGHERPLTDELAALLAPVAWRFYESLPERVLTWGDIVRFVLADARGTLFLVLGIGIVSGLLGLIQPLAVEYLTAKVIPTANQLELRQLTILLIALTFSGVYLSLVPKLILLNFATRQKERFESAIFERLFRSTVNFVRQFNAGDLCTRIMDISRIQEVLFNVLANQIMGTVFSLASLVMLFIYSWRLTLVGIAITLLYALLTFFVLHHALPHIILLGRIKGNMAGLLKQFFDGIGKIRTAGAEEPVISRFLDEFIPASKAGYVIQANAGRLAVLNVLFPAAVSLFFFWLVGGVWNTSLSMPEYLAFISAFSGFQGGVLGLCDGTWEIWKVKQGLKRLTPIIQAEPEMALGQRYPGTLDGHVELAHISFRYAADRPPVLDDVCISAKPGEFIAVVGPSGSGKSTLVRILLGFEHPESGSVFYSGNTLSDLDARAVRRQLGVVLQNSRVMPGTILSNIITGTEYTLQDAEKAVAMAALDTDVAAMPMELFTMVGEGLLSGGQEQRLLIARALVGNPPILILDESTSALDNITQEQVRENIEKLQVTRIVIAHRLSTIVKADRIYVLEQGRIVQSGSYASLMAEEGLFRKLTQSQLL